MHSVKKFSDGEAKKLDCMACLTI